MTEPRNAPAYAELLEWMEEAVEYVNKGTRSPSLEEEGRKLLRLAQRPVPERSEADREMFAKLGGPELSAEAILTEWVAAIKKAHS